MARPPIEDIKATVRSILLSEFLAGEDPDALLDSTPLITGGVLDSLSLLKFAASLEERFQIKVQAHELSVDYMDTVADIGKLIEAKVAAA